MIFNQPFYHIFKQLYKHDETSLILSILQGMSSKYPPIGYLLLFYVCCSKIQEKSGISREDYNLTYVEFYEGNDKEIQLKLASDMEVRIYD